MYKHLEEYLAKREENWTIFEERVDKEIEVNEFRIELIRNNVIQIED